MLTRSFSTQTSPEQSLFSSDHESSWQRSGAATSNDLLTVSRLSLVVSCGLQGATYPLLALRRQCQISTHYTPSFGLFTPLGNVGLLYHVAYNQGWQSLWKGAWHNSVYAAAQLFSNAAIINFFEGHNRPRRSRSGLVQVITTYIPVQCISTIVLAPLYSICLLEMVQNTQQKIYTGGLSGAWELFMQRPMLSSSEDKVSMISVLVPMVALSVAQELLQPVIQHSVKYVQSRWLTTTTSNEKDLVTTVTTRLWIWYWSSLITDLITYPIETVIAQMLSQGLPMLVDNVNDGNEVIYLSTNCVGLTDYFKSVWSTHGLSGLYRGLSSLLLQYGLQTLLLYVTSHVASNVRNRMRQSHS
ncbi:mitochondrial outer membrane protein SLC25A46-like isoform X1 [Dysidea avara]|uniref:mitochondrial outer membrane protein SLC25A46-like isoform X1 n=1 Tax=Dysidea avara TaxID=196820 RepID=UPI00332B17D0